MRNPDRDRALAYAAERRVSVDALRRELRAAAVGSWDDDRIPSIIEDLRPPSIDDDPVAVAARENVVARLRAYLLRPANYTPHEDELIEALSRSPRDFGRLVWSEIEDSDIANAVRLHVRKA